MITNSKRYKPTVTVLFIENDRAIAESLVAALIHRQIYVHWVETLSEATEFLAQIGADLIVSGGMFPHRPGEAEQKGFVPFMEHMKERGLRIPVIAWSNSTHVHESALANGIASFSKIELTRERFLQKQREYIPVEVRSAGQMADVVLEKLLEVHQIRKVLSSRSFRYYYEEPITVLAAFMALDMRTSMFSDTAGLNYGPIITELRNRIGTLYVDPQNDAAIAAAIFQKITQQQYFPTIEQAVQAKAEALLEYSKPLVRKDFSTDSNEQLSEQYQEFVRRFMEMRTYSSLPTAMEHETNRWTEHLTEILKSNIENHEEFNRVFATLTSPENTSYVNEYELAVARYGLARLRGEDAALQLETILKDWAWIHYAFEGEWLTTADVEAKLEALGGTQRALESFIDEFAERPSKLKQQKAAPIDRYHLNPGAQEAFRIGAEIVFVKFFRKGIFAQAYYSVEFLLEEIGKRIGCSRKQVVNMLPEEVLAALKLQSFPASLIDARVESSVTISLDGRTFAFPLSVRSLYESSIEGKDVAQGVELKGQTAFAGRAAGIVKVVNLPAEMDKLEPGNILVSRSTNPSLVPAMRRAAAFVTDLGGLTCHAAIVAREMKKPCIVGTKTATQQLKDGDWITVDATKGIVTIEETA